jgi:hypothetical protein
MQVQISVRDLFIVYHTKLNSAASLLNYYAATPPDCVESVRVIERPEGDLLSLVEVAHIGASSSRLAATTIAQMLLPGMLSILPTE